MTKVITLRASIAGARPDRKFKDLTEEELLKWVCEHVEDPASNFDKWESEAGWQKVPREFIWNLVGFTGPAPANSVVVNSLYVKKFGNDMIGVRTSMLERNVPIFGSRDKTDATFSGYSLIPSTNGPCTLGENNEILYKIDEGRSFKFHTDHPDWPLMLHRPERFLALAIAEHLVSKHETSPLTPIARDKREPTYNYVVQDLTRSLERLRDALRNNIA